MAFALRMSVKLAWVALENFGVFRYIFYAFACRNVNQMNNYDEIFYIALWRCARYLNFWQINWKRVSAGRGCNNPRHCRLFGRVPFYGMIQIVIFIYIELI